MTLDVIVVGTVALSAAALIGYRLLGKKGKDVTVKSTDFGLFYFPPSVVNINIKSAMMVLVSIIVLVSSLYIILSGQYDDGSQKWAFGSVGSIMGFWLRPEAQQKRATPVNSK